MKKILLITSIIVSTLTSCKKDYECTTVIFGVETTATCEKCSKSDVEEIENAGWECE